MGPLILRWDEWKISKKKIAVDIASAFCYLFNCHFKLSGAMCLFIVSKQCGADFSSYGSHQAFQTEFVLHHFLVPSTNIIAFLLAVCLMDESVYEIRNLRNLVLSMCLCFFVIISYLSNNKQEMSLKRKRF